MALLKRRQAGDTIVEVLICVLLVSIILGGAYTTIRRSSTGIRNAQEHAEVLKAVQGQVEQLRSSVTAGSSTVFTVGQPFCMVDNVAVPTTALPEGARCTQDATGQPAAGEPAYRMSITRGEETGNAVLFVVRGDWQSIVGSPSQETILFRMQRQ